MNRGGWEPKVMRCPNPKCRAKMVWSEAEKRWKCPRCKLT